MENAIQSTLYKGYAINIYNDDNAVCALLDYDHAGKIGIYPGRYDRSVPRIDPDKMGDLESAILEAHACKATLVYMLTCDEDSTHMERVYLRKEEIVILEDGEMIVNIGKVEDEKWNGIFFVPRVSVKWGKADGKTATQWAEGYCKGVIDDFNQWRRGEVCGFVVTKADGSDIDSDIGSILDSCWGYYDIDYCEAEAKGEIDCLPAELTNEI